MPPLMLTTALILSGVVTASATPAPQSDNDITLAEIGRFDRFLDTHPAIAEALAKNPSLIASNDFIASQPALQAFLQQHPAIRADLQSNPRIVMEDLVRFDAAEANGKLPPAARQDAMNAAQVSELDSFLDAHPTLSRELEANPSLIRNRDFLKDHPELVTFLQNHPDLAEDWRSNPRAAMTALAAFDAAAADSLSRAQVSTLDGFMDNHPEIAHQLEANPALIDSRDYLSDHPQLVAFLRSHPEIAQDWSSNPQIAMKDLARFDAATAIKPTPAPTPAPVPPVPKPADDITPGDVATFDAFLNKHPAIIEQLRAHPALITESSFISDNPELKAFVESHPAIALQLKTDPSLLLKDTVKYNEATSANADSNVRRPTDTRK